MTVWRVDVCYYSHKLARERICSPSNKDQARKILRAALVFELKSGSVFLPSLDTHNRKQFPNMIWILQRVISHPTVSTLPLLLSLLQVRVVIADTCTYYENWGKAIFLSHALSSTQILNAGMYKR